MSLLPYVPQHTVVLPEQPDASLMTYTKKSLSCVIGSSNALEVGDLGFKLDWKLNDMRYDYEISLTVEDQNKASPPVIACTRATDPQVVAKKTKKRPRRTTGGKVKGKVKRRVSSAPQNGRVRKMPRPSRSFTRVPVCMLENLPDDKPQRFRPAGKVKNFSPQAALKPKKVSVHAKGPANPHPMSRKKSLRNMARYPMDCKQLALFFHRMNKNCDKMELIFSLLGTRDAQTLRNFRSQLVDVRQSIKTVLTEIDALLPEHGRPYAKF